MSADGAYEQAVAADVTRVEARLAALVDRHAAAHARIRDAIRYSLLAGGKRMRPLLCLWTHDALGGKHPAVALDVACALECVHTYSLIHDDLPCMDDDDFRRGQPSAHRRFDEATAVLAGDALLNLTYEILVAMETPAETRIDVLRVVALAAGTGGLITGQALDLESTGNPGDVARVEQIHTFKTARLIAAAVESGALCAGAAADVRARAAQAGLRAGQAFQITDDLLDLEGTHATLGKTPGKDVARHKLTFPAVAGVDAARARARALGDEALSLLPEATGRPLERLIERMHRRSH